MSRVERLTLYPNNKPRAKQSDEINDSQPCRRSIVTGQATALQVRETEQMQRTRTYSKQTHGSIHLRKLMPGQESMKCNPFLIFGG